MGKRSRAKKETSRQPAPIAIPRAKPNWPLFALSLCGVILTGYLTWTAFHGANVKGCAVGAGCDVVLTSKWSRILGLPTSFWGLLAYLALSGSAFLAKTNSRWMLSWTISMLGVMYSIYLTVISLTVLKATCPYCLTSLSLMITILLFTTFHRRLADSVSWTRLIQITVPVGLAVILVLHLNYVGLLGETPVAEDPEARALASYLAEQGVKFYGAYWCPHCQQQKEMFGLSASRLPYIECSPGGQNQPQSPECREANIKTYPTWIINGQRIEEVLSLQRLAQSTGFHLDAAK